MNHLKELINLAKKDFDDCQTLTELDNAKAKYVGKSGTLTEAMRGLSKLSNEEIMSAIKEGAAKLNEMLDLGLNEDTYIRTKGYKNRLDNLKKQRPKLDAKKIKRNVNDMSFNYAQTDFKFEEQSNA